MMHSNERVATWNRAIAAWLCMAVMAGPLPLVTAAASEASGQTFDDGDDGDFARKHDLLSSPDWQRAVAELGGWLVVQRVYPPPRSAVSRPASTTGWLRCRRTNWSTSSTRSR